MMAVERARCELEEAAVDVQRSAQMVEEFEACMSFQRG